MAGLVAEEIKEDIFGAGDKSLEETVKVIEAKESAKRAKSTLIQVLNNQTQVNKVSDSDKNNPRNTRGCTHCGRKDHTGSLEDRKQHCPAFNKKCERCERVGHFKKKMFIWKKEN